MDSKYVRGSEGFKNLFFRPAGTEYVYGREKYPATAESGQWIIQWEGSPEYDSGYYQQNFATELEAREAFKTA